MIALALPNVPFFIKMRALYELTITLRNLIQGKATDTANAKVRAGKGADNIPMYYCALQIINAIPVAWLQWYSREVAEEAAGESVSRARGINNFLQWVSGCAEIRTIRAKEQCTITS
jgi:hypothetical protein